MDDCSKFQITMTYELRTVDPTDSNFPTESKNTLPPVTDTCTTTDTSGLVVGCQNHFRLNDEEMPTELIVELKLLHEFWTADIHPLQVSN